MQYRARVNLVGQFLQISEVHKNRQLKQVVEEVQKAQFNAQKMDMPANQFDYMQMNRLESFESAFSGALVTMTSAFDHAPHLQKDARYLLLKQQLASLEARIAAAESKFRKDGPAYNERLQHIP